MSGKVSIGGHGNEKVIIVVYDIIIMFVLCRGGCIVETDLIL